MMPVKDFEYQEKLKKVNEKLPNYLISSLFCMTQSFR